MDFKNVKNQIINCVLYTSKNMSSYVNFFFYLWHGDLKVDVGKHIPPSLFIKNNSIYLLSIICRNTIPFYLQNKWVCKTNAKTPWFIYIQFAKDDWRIMGNDIGNPTVFLSLMKYSGTVVQFNLRPKFKISRKTGFSW